MRLSEKLSVAIHCLLFINEYGSSKKVTSEMLAASCGVNPVTIRGVLSSLKKEGIIDVKSGTGGATLACNPENITLRRVFDAVKSQNATSIFAKHAFPSAVCPVGKKIYRVLDRTYAKVEDDFFKSLDKITLAEIAEDYHNIKTK